MYYTYLLDDKLIYEGDDPNFDKEQTESFVELVRNNFNSRRCFEYCIDKDGSD